MLGAFVEVLSVESASPEAQSPSEKVIPRLMNTALQDKVPHVQLAAIRVLEALSGRIGAAEYAAQLAGALQSEHVAARWGAMRALRALGTDAMTTYARELAILVRIRHALEPYVLLMTRRHRWASLWVVSITGLGGLTFWPRGLRCSRRAWKAEAVPEQLPGTGLWVLGGDESYFCADSTTRSRGPRVLEVIQRTHPERLSLLDGYAPTEEDKESYFKQYGCLEEQMTMLQDSVRMQAYRNAIETSVADFRDKVVLDVGCGTGVLAIFAAKAGARKVYAVEASDMASAAKQVVAANGVDKVVEVIRGMVETIELPEKVDVIISEWMGNFLLKESMLDTVLIARDRFLKPGGLLFPSHARLFLAPCAHSCFAERWQSYVDELWAWRSFVQHMHVSFGLSYGPLTTQQEKEASEHHLQSWDWVHLNSSHLRGPPVQLLALDLATLPLSRLQSLHEQAFDIVLPITKDGTVGGLCRDVTVGDGPSSFWKLPKATHWGQQLFGFFPESVDLFGPPAQLGLAVLQGDELCGRWRLGRVAQTRDFRLEVELNHTSANGLLGSYHEAWKRHLAVSPRLAGRKLAAPSDDSWYVRTLATELVHELGPLGAESSQPVLSKALHSLDQEVRRNAALALGKQAKVASKHAGALCTRMLGNRPGVTSDDPDADLSERLEVRTACMWALGQLEPEAVMPHIHNLDDGLFHRNPRYRLVATQALANLGPKAIQTRKDHLMVMESTDRDDDVWKGRSDKMKVSPKHFVLKTPMEGPWPDNMKVCVLANGCFWGSEKGFWRLPGGGIYATAVGYAAGQTANPTYEETPKEVLGG
eukprot:s5453_g5.t9